MSTDSTTNSERLIELEELYKIAEASTENLDKLEAESDRLRIRGIISLLVGYLLLIIGLVALYFLSQSGINNGINVVYVLAAALSVLSGFFLSYMAFEFVRRRKTLSKEKRIEIDIQKKLFVLISEQMNRAHAYERMSPVTRAMYEIRSRRMWRMDDDVSRSS